MCFRGSVGRFVGNSTRQLCAAGSTWTMWRQFSTKESGEGRSFCQGDSEASHRVRETCYLFWTTRQLLVLRNRLSWLVSVGQRWRGSPFPGSWQTAQTRQMRGLPLAAVRAETSHSGLWRRAKEYHPSGLPKQYLLVFGSGDSFSTDIVVPSMQGSRRKPMQQARGSANKRISRSISSLKIFAHVVCGMAALVIPPDFQSSSGNPTRSDNSKSTKKNDDIRMAHPQKDNYKTNFAHPRGGPARDCRATSFRRIKRESADATYSQSI